MALPTTRVRVFRRIAGAPALAGLLVLALAGCSPAIETWRDMQGVSKNDPDPVNAPFTRNLADAEAAPYPNLASVPPPPTRATTAAERQKLTQSLVADRATTEAAAGPRAALRATATAAARSPSPAAMAASPAAAGGAAAPSKTASSLPSPGQSGRRSASEPPAPSPRDSTMEMPDVRSLPEPETARAAPPPPGLTAMPRPAVAAEPPAALATATPQAAPPVPDLAPAPAPPPPAGKTATKQPPAVTTVATLDAPGGTAEIARVAALYKEKPGGVRVVGYAAASTAGGDPLASYQAALYRAQAVAKSLIAAGIPAGKIQTEATPAAGARAAARVEIQFAQ